MSLFLRIINIISSYLLRKHNFILHNSINVLSLRVFSRQKSMRFQWSLFTVVQRIGLYRLRAPKNWITKLRAMPSRFFILRPVFFAALFFLEGVFLKWNFLFENNWLVWHFFAPSFLNKKFEGVFPHCPQFRPLVFFSYPQFIYA